MQARRKIRFEILRDHDRRRSLQGHQRPIRAPCQRRDAEGRRAHYRVANARRTHCAGTAARSFSRCWSKRRRRTQRASPIGFDGRSARRRSTSTTGSFRSPAASASRSINRLSIPRVRSEPGRQDPAPREARGQGPDRDFTLTLQNRAGENLAQPNEALGYGALGGGTKSVKYVVDTGNRAPCMRLVTVLRICAAFEPSYPVDRLSTSRAVSPLAHVSPAWPH